MTKILTRAASLLSKKTDNLHFFASNSEKIASLLEAEIDKNVTIIANSKHRTTVNEIMGKFKSSK